MAGRSRYKVIAGKVALSFGLMSLTFFVYRLAAHLRDMKDMRKKDYSLRKHWRPAPCR